MFIYLFKKEKKQGRGDLQDRKWTWEWKPRPGLGSEQPYPLSRPTSPNSTFPKTALPALPLTRADTVYPTGAFPASREVPGTHRRQTRP